MTDIRHDTAEHTKTSPGGQPSALLAKFVAGFAFRMHDLWDVDCIEAGSLHAHAACSVSLQDAVI